MNGRSKLVLGLVGALGWGCGVSTDQACNDAANALCALYDRCQADAGTLIRFGDFATCVAREKMYCVASSTAAGTGRTPQLTEDCVKVRPTEACTDFFANSHPTACLAVAGTVPNGSPCAFDDQCQSAFCAVPRFATCGTCAPVPNPGDDCTAVDKCNFDQHCQTVKTDGGAVAQAVCANWVQGGGACNRYSPCLPEYSCVGAINYSDGGFFSGICLAQGTSVGTPCDPTTKTDAGCAGLLNLFCSNAANQTCAETTFVGTGEGCGVQTDGGDGACYQGAACEPVAGSKARVCEAPAADGSACDTVQGPPCLYPAKCVTATGGPGPGTCTLPDATACH